MATSEQCVCVCVCVCVCACVHVCMCVCGSMQLGSVHAWLWSRVNCEFDFYPGLAVNVVTMSESLYLHCSSVHEAPL